MDHQSLKMPCLKELNWIRSSPSVLSKAKRLLSRGWMENLFSHLPSWIFSQHEPTPPLPPPLKSPLAHQHPPRSSLFSAPLLCRSPRLSPLHPPRPSLFPSPTLCRPPRLPPSWPPRLPSRPPRLPPSLTLLPPAPLICWSPRLPPAPTLLPPSTPLPPLTLLPPRLHRSLLPTLQSHPPPPLARISRKRGPRARPPQSSRSLL
mmetsp:Transcript_45276/g.113981  ORF Transcript_45276/g.113981 Transcript_45276/m.113981 type:complete len:204 (-) Transcript_45276:383-994(-)